VVGEQGERCLLIISGGFWRRWPNAVSVERDLVNFIADLITITTTLIATFGQRLGVA